MNEQNELAVLKQEQARLEKELALMSLRLERLERRVKYGAAEPQQSPEQLSEQLSNAPGLSLSPEAPLPAQARTAEVLQPQSPPADQPFAVPPIIELAEDYQAIPPLITTSQSEAHFRREPEAGPALQRVAPAQRERSLELRLGTYWAPRIGIVVLLTGLVFLGNLAYQKLGATGKVLLMYMASAILLGAGSWWQRNGKDALKNYAQVLFAGGLAILYFTTYAAHHLDSLRVIQSALLDGVLLLGCAGFMVWTADRWKSEILAIFGTGLAYYTCVMTHVGFFTLYSNLVLTIAAVFFLVRNRWLGLTFGSLVATYAAYGFWRFFSGSHWHWASPTEGLWSGVYFLASYWVVFTAGVFLSRDEKFAGQNRAAFLTLNNGAFFTMFVLTMLQVNTGGFWRFCLIYGGVLLALAETSRRLLPREKAARNFYLTQGLLLVTIGLISKFAGLQLALILAAESMILLMLAYQRQNLVLYTGAYIAAILAIGWGMDGMLQNDAPGAYLAVGLGALMLANALLVHYFIESRGAAGAGAESLGIDSGSAWATISGIAGGASARSVSQARSAWPVPASIRPQVAYFVVLALSVWLVATWNNVSHEIFPVVLAAEGVALTLSIYFLRAREITLLSQGYCLLAVFAWLARWADTGTPPAWWNPSLLILMLLLLSHWWQKQKRVAAPAELSLSAQLLFALSLVGLLFFWIGKLVSPAEWMAITSLLAIALTAYGVLTRAWMIAACGQLFVLMSSLQFARGLVNGHPNAWLALAPIAALGVLSASTIQWFRTRPESSGNVRQVLLQIAQLYRWAALPMSLAWIFEYVLPSGRVLALTAVGAAVFLFAGWKKSREALLYGAFFTATGLATFWITSEQMDSISWANLVAILIIPVQQQVASRQPQNFILSPRAHGAAIVAGGVTLWWFCTRWVMEQSSGFFLTASWSGLALLFFACGIVIRERVYRWLGLSLLALALGRIVVVDVWRLEMLYRILSFMALGIVLLVLGFVYSKYQEKIRQWL